MLQRRSLPDALSLSLSRPSLQEERPVFDIHDYSDRVVAALSSVGHRRSLASIVAGLDNFEACKYLLASLQLVSQTFRGHQNWMKVMKNLQENQIFM